MLNRSKIFIVTTLLVASIVTSANAGPGQGGFNRGDFSERRLDRMAERLELSGEQLTQIRTIIDETRPSLRTYHDQLRANRQQLRQLAKANSVDDNLLQALANEQGDLIAEMIVLRSQQQRAIRAVLTPAQQAQADALKGQRRHR